MVVYGCYYQKKKTKFYFKTLDVRPCASLLSEVRPPKMCKHHLFFSLTSDRKTVCIFKVFLKEKKQIKHHIFFIIIIYIYLCIIFGTNQKKEKNPFSLKLSKILFKNFHKTLKNKDL